MGKEERKRLEQYCYDGSRHFSIREASTKETSLCSDKVEALAQMEKNNAKMDELQAKLYAERLGNSSLTLGHRIESLDGSILHCDGNVVLVWIDRTSGKSAALPQALRAACT